MDHSAFALRLRFAFLKHMQIQQQSHRRILLSNGNYTTSHAIRQSFWTTYVRNCVVAEARFALIPASTELCPVDFMRAVTHLHEQVVRRLVADGLCTVTLQRVYSTDFEKLLDQFSTTILDQAAFSITELEPLLSDEDQYSDLLYATHSLDLTALPYKNPLH